MLFSEKLSTGKESREADSKVNRCLRGVLGGFSFFFVAMSSHRIVKSAEQGSARVIGKGNQFNYVG